MSNFQSIKLSLPIFILLFNSSPVSIGIHPSAQIKTVRNVPFVEIVKTVQLIYTNKSFLELIVCTEAEYTSTEVHIFPVTSVCSSGMLNISTHKWHIFGLTSVH
jgi:hypothetical protein